MAEQWALDTDGNIIVRPLIEVQTMVFGGMTIGVRLQYAQPGDALMSPTGNLQLAITPVQAEQLAQVLQRTAARILQQPTSGEPRN